MAVITIRRNRGFFIGTPFLLTPKINPSTLCHTAERTVIYLLWAAALVCLGDSSSSFCACSQPNCARARTVRLSSALLRYQLWRVPIDTSKMAHSCSGLYATCFTQAFNSSPLTINILSFYTIFSTLNYTINKSGGLLCLSP